MRGLVIDNFAGGGGASTGIEAAIGRPIDIAINHDPEAIAMHQANHPHTKHFCQSIMSIDPLEATQGMPVDLAWFSPDCKHFSKAKGGKPVEKNIRDLAWVVVHWAKRLGANKPKVIMLENVEEFRQWGPLTNEGRPCPEGKGKIFDQWVRKLRRLGYQVQWRTLRACDFGAPTMRKRLFLIARCDNQPIIWPEPTHGEGRPNEWLTAANIIDWSIPCPSIFERKRPLKPATCRRIATGIMRYVIDSDRPFIVPVTHTQGGNTAQPIDDPLRTVTTAKGGEFAIATPHLVSVAHGDSGGRREYPMDKEPIGTLTRTGQFALVAAFMAQHNGGRVGHPTDKPLSTIVHRGTQQNLVTSNLIKLRNNSNAQSVEAPIGTLTAGGGHFAEVRAFLIKYYSSGGQWGDLGDPLATVTANDRMGLVTCTINDVKYAIADIGMRMLATKELYAAQGFPPDYITAIAGPNGKPLTKTAQVRMCGNSVCPPVPEALVRANLPELCQERKAA